MALIMFFQHTLHMSPVIASILGAAIAVPVAAAYVYEMARRRNPLSSNTHWLKAALRAIFNGIVRMGLGPLIVPDNSPELPLLPEPKFAYLWRESPPIFDLELLGLRLLEPPFWMRPQFLSGYVPYAHA
jgi:hypothetical protein